MVECPICHGKKKCIMKPKGCAGCTFNKAIKQDDVDCPFGEKCPTCGGTGTVTQQELDAVCV